MDSLPHRTDISFLSGKDLDQVCFEQGSLSLQFYAPMSNRKGTGICVQSKIVHRSNKSVFEWDCAKTLGSFCSLLMLLRSTVTRAVGRPDGALELEFSNGDLVTIPGGIHKKESYRVWDGETVIVV